MGYAEQEAQRKAVQRMGRSSGAQAGVARVGRTVGKSSGGAKFFGEVMRAFKSMGPMG
jgi:hypothetical protein